MCVQYVYVEADGGNGIGGTCGMCKMNECNMISHVPSVSCLGFECKKSFMFPVSVNSQTKLMFLVLDNKM